MRTKQTVMVSVLLIGLFLAIFLMFTSLSKAANIVGPNYRNVSVWTHVNITNAKPEVLSVIIYMPLNTTANNVVLSGGSTKTVTCNATLRDWNGYADIVNVSGILYFNSTLYNASDDNNTHYSNNNCTNTGNGVNYTVNYLCNFSVYYYANNGTWQCLVNATDTFNKTGTGFNYTTVNLLYALNVTDGIDYGNVAVEDTSFEQTANITNYGNAAINISVEGYGVNRGDGLAMNCSLNGNITVANERFSTFTGVYATKTALASSQQLISNLTMPKQILANTSILNTTYWQLFIPANPAGNCTGYVVFMAQAP